MSVLKITNKLKSYLAFFIFSFITITDANNEMFRTQEKLYEGSGWLYDESQIFMDVPEILSQEDIKLYKEIFSLQEKGHFKSADKKIAQLENKFLMGHVLYQRYMGDHYISRYKELKEWLAKYNDYPNADKIYKLALRKGGKSARGSLTRPMKPIKSIHNLANFAAQEHGVSVDTPIYSKNYNTNKAVSMMSKHLRYGNTLNAKTVLKDYKTKISSKNYHNLSSRLAFSYFLDGMDDLAIKWAKDAADKYDFPLADWTLGLSYFRQEKYDMAKEYFRKLAYKDGLSPWVVSAAAYWAHRSNEKAQIKEESNIYLETAALFPQTFYGIIANSALGNDLKLNEIAANFSIRDAKNILSWEAGFRAIALLEIDDYVNARRELTHLVSLYPSDELSYSVLALAEKMQIPSIVYKNAYTAYDNDSIINSSAYPLIPWQPVDGWKVDKALVFALIRQESQFKTNAKSSAGASGLMQIMPSTARYISRTSYLNIPKSQIYTPEYNLSLGQNYITHLMSDGRIDNNLFYVLVAYNAGPGNLSRWKRKAKTDDPLLFIESIPARETRNYIEKVLTNYWIYRKRMYQKTPSLEHVINDQWPEYHSQDIDVKYAQK
jgi:soluble lytic murein transglycosylase-like protein